MSFANVLKQFKKTKRKPKSSLGSSTVNTDNTSELSNSLDVIGKNSMALPVMMRDINVMKQGILKLVKIAGGTQRDKADRFFSSAADREKSYESQIASTKSTSPTKIGGKDKDGKGFFGKTNDFLNSMIAGGLTNLLIKGGLIAGILYAIGKFFTSSEFRKSASDMIGNLGKTVFGEEGWKDVKKSITTGAVILLTGIVAVKTALIYLSAMIKAHAWSLAGGRGVPGGKNKGKSPMGRMFRGFGYAGVGLGLYNMFSGGDGEESSGLGGIASAATGLAVGSALDNRSTPKTEPTKPKEQYRDPKTGRYAKTPSSKWSRFLVFLEKKTPDLFKKIGKRLLLAGAGLAVPGPGWIMTAINVLGSISLAWELYGWWKEFNNESDESSNSPEKINSSDESTGADTIRQLISQSGGISLSGGANPDYYGNAGKSPSTSTSPTPAGPVGTGGGMTFNQLSREQQDALMAEQRKQEGFKPGSLSYDLNNPGNIQYGEFAKKYGGERDTTGRGVGSHKGTFARFPTLEQGVEAQRALWSSKNYGNLPLEQALKRWAPDSGSNYSDKIISAAVSGKSTPVIAANAQTKVSGTQLNQGSRQLSNSQNAPSGTPMVINAPTTNMNSGGGSSISLPASGVLDNELAKLIVERAIG